MDDDHIKTHKFKLMPESLYSQMEDDIILGRVTPDWKKCVERDFGILVDQINMIHKRLYNLEESLLNMQKEIDWLQDKYDENSAAIKACNKELDY